MNKGRWEILEGRMRGNETMTGAVLARLDALEREVKEVSECLGHAARSLSLVNGKLEQVLKKLSGRDE